jgi:dTDP-4-dehydrorhamnose 3,5-epimerase
MIKKPIVIRNPIYDDKRGFFQEIYLKKIINVRVLFTAIAYSRKNVIRGLHFQNKNKQTKIIYVVSGEILDVIVDLNKSSSTFGKVIKYRLKKGDVLFVPNTYAHGYECLSENCVVLYHLDKYRSKKNEKGIAYDDKSLKIQWKTKNPITSLRDKSNISFEDFKKKFKSL